MKIQLTIYDYIGKRQTYQKGIRLEKSTDKHYQESCGNLCHAGHLVWGQGNEPEQEHIYQNRGIPDHDWEF